MNKRHNNLDMYEDIKPLYNGYNIFTSKILEPLYPEDVKSRAEAYLKYIGAIYVQEDDSWDFDGDILCCASNFLVWNGSITVNFGYVSGAFICTGEELDSDKNFPINCEFFNISENNIKTIKRLPIAEAYFLNDNPLEFIGDDLFNPKAEEINISNCNLRHLPIIRTTYLESFKCSYNKLENLNNLPYALNVYASDNNIKILSTEHFCFNGTIQFIDISYNSFPNLIGIPKAERIKCSNNNKLKSFEGINNRYDISNKLNSQTLSNFLGRCLDASNTEIENLDFLEGDFYSLNVSNTKIKNFKNYDITLIWDFVVDDNRIEDFSVDDFRINTLYLSYLSIHKDENLNNFLKNVSNIRIDFKDTLNNSPIDFNDRNLKDSIEVKFFNEYASALPGNKNSKEQIFYINNYNNSFLKYLFNNKHADMNNSKMTINDFRWPNSFHKQIINIDNSLEVNNRFNL